MNYIKKKEYNIGDFVEIHNYNCTYNSKKMKGIIVRKILKDEFERKIYWFKHDYDYLVSTKEYKGDYASVEFTNILGEINIPLEYKLSFIASFDEWWQQEHKSIYQYFLIICASISIQNSLLK